MQLFSALYKMLPSSKNSLMKAGFTSQEAAWILIACFLGGVIGIQFITNILHGFMPTHAVDCDHSHEAEDGHGETKRADQHQRPGSSLSRRKSSLPGHIFHNGSGKGYQSRQTSYFTPTHSHAQYGPTEESEDQYSTVRRPSLHQRVTNKLSQLSLSKPECDSTGPCHGFSDPCGNECFKNITARGGFRAIGRTGSMKKKPSLTRITTVDPIVETETTPLLEQISEVSARPHIHHHYDSSTPASYHTQEPASPTLDDQDPPTPTQETSPPPPELHHHHVPTNAFLSIGLQTSIAIALHKLPEGFITYATNHANPSLGVSVFLALFIHNITEGFAMALPLYLALNSRLKAMLISFLLGGLSQPIGAAVAAVWFKLAGRGNWAPSEGMYGGMFAVTAGIMASVALQLFSESLDLTHSRALCMFGAFAGMGILGISSALTA